MSRKHFIALASAISAITDVNERERVAELIGAVCSACNANFSWSTWYSACGVKA